MLISDNIARLIEKNALTTAAGSPSCKRNDLAPQLGCVPSQINYVITSRFTPGNADTLPKADEAVEDI